MKRVWNITNAAIYSLISFDRNNVPNINICSYVSVISLKPKLYLVAIEKTSKTHKNISDNSFCILQILSADNISIVKFVGKKSGWKTDKINYIRKKKLLELWQNKEIIKNSSGIIFLNKIDTLETIGDHTLFIFEIQKSKTINESNILTFNKLIEDKIIL